MRAYVELVLAVLGLGLITLGFFSYSQGLGLIFAGVSCLLIGWRIVGD